MMVLEASASFVAHVAVVANFCLRKLLLSLL